MDVAACKPRNLLPAEAIAERASCGLRDLTICDALAIWSSWQADVPFDGPTGSAALDVLLADAFRAMLACATLPQRLAWLERQLAQQGEFPYSARPADRYIETLMRWWLDLFEEARGG